MADLADQAQAYEASSLRAALAAARPAPPGNQLVVHGVVCCADCEEPIPAARLRSIPDATRCRDCQGAHERGPRC